MRIIKIGNYAINLNHVEHAMIYGDEIKIVFINGQDVRIMLNDREMAERSLMFICDSSGAK